MSTTQVFGGAAPDLSSGVGSPGGGSNVDHALQIEICVRAILAEKAMEISSILEITQGTILEFDKGFDEDLELHASNQLVAKGRAVKVGENFGLRVSSIRSVEDRIHALGPRG